MTDLRRSPSLLAELISEHPVPLDHPGSRYHYVVKGCRCKKCTTANATYQKDYMCRRRAKGMVDKHGKRKEDKAFT